MSDDSGYQEPYRPHVVIVGGGFGGLYAARALKHAPVRVTLVDRHNYHLFQPLLYQVATATLSPADIARPIRQVVRRQRNTTVTLAEVTDVDPGRRELTLADGRTLRYDFLILAAGAVDQYFGHDEWVTVAPGMKTIDDATEIRRRFLLAFEHAEQVRDPELRRALLTFVVIGGGPTGVEMAGAFAEIARHTLRNEFRNVDPASARILLIEGGPRLLSAYGEDLSGRALEQLRALGVEVRLDSIVTRIELGSVYVGEERIPAYPVVWAAGVAASPLGRRLGVPTDRMGRVEVLPDLSIPGHPEVFVIGDMASFPHQTGKPLPGVAQVALQGGRTAAGNVLRTMRGEPRARFRYRDKGSMATIGRAKAIAQIGRVKLSGFVAWLAWLFVHVFFLIGFRNRVAVFMEWAWSYLTWQRGARLITGEVRPDNALRKLGLPVPPEGGSEPEAARAIRSPAPEGGGGWMEGDSEQARAAAPRAEG
ncbi:MAG TPA: NAD(P)/FAD-dependent oxidoreductase [Longimicrobiaceae bacterium]|nr:NAD(P)/FAD-dependent oxidoreductase [Longimicrobiaceae bacterium]